MNRTLSVNYDGDLPASLGYDNVEQFEQDMRIALALRVYQSGQVSTGWCADFAGVSKIILLDKMAEYGVKPFSLSRSEFQKELDVVQSHL